MLLVVGGAIELVTNGVDVLGVTYMLVDGATIELLGVSDTTEVVTGGATEVVTGGATELELGSTTELLDTSTYTLLDVGGETELVNICELLGVTYEE